MYKSDNWNHDKYKVKILELQLKKLSSAERNWQKHKVSIDAVNVRTDR